MSAVQKSLLAGCIALCATSAPLWAAVGFTENFDSNPTCYWTFKSSISGDAATDTTGGAADFYFDYSSIGIPPAPSSGGTTRGLKVQANVPGTGVFSGISVSPNNLHITGDFTMTAEVWQNANGAFPAGGSGSTQVTFFGYGNTGNAVQFPGGATFKSMMFGVTAEGGSIVDYRAYLGNGGFTGVAPFPNISAGSILTDVSGVYASGNTAGATNNTFGGGTGYWATSFPGLTPPAAQTALFPQQTGTTAAGAQAFKWRVWEFQRVGTIMTWKIDGILVATVDTNVVSGGFTFDGDDIYFGQFDINAGSSADVNARALLFGLVDNVTVNCDTCTFAQLPCISGQPANQVVNMDANASFTVTASPALGGGLSYQWYRGADVLSNGTLPDGTIVSGATLATLSLTNVQYGENGQLFHVVVTESGNPNTATSNNATLTVILPACHQPFADADGDILPSLTVGDVDLDDFGIVQRCFTGSGPVLDYGHCYCFDRNQDNKIDSADLALFASCATGAGVPADPNCGNYPTGKVVINEVVYDVTTAAANNEFVELYNASATPVDISGWKLRVSGSVGPGVTGNDDGFPDYTVTGAPGTGTTVLAPGGFYVMGGSLTPVLNQLLGTGNLFPNANTAIELLDGNGAIKDTVVYEANGGSIAIGTPEGSIWGNFQENNLNYLSLSRWVDGVDRNINGRDFGLRPRTPGASNVSLPAASYVVPDVESAASGTDVTAINFPGAGGLNGAFTNAKVIDPQVADALPLTAGGGNPSVIPNPPGKTKAIIAFDSTSGGGDTVVSDITMNGNASYSLMVYLETVDLPASSNASAVFFRSSEETAYGIGSSDSFMNLADVSGTVGVPDTATGLTGIFWYYERVGNAVSTAGVETPNTQSKKLYLIDAGPGADAGLGGTRPLAWTVLETIDLSSVPSGWYPLQLTYTAATGAITAAFNGTPYAHTTATGLAGNFYVAYRENMQSGAAILPTFIRPPTFLAGP